MLRRIAKDLDNLLNDGDFTFPYSYKFYKKSDNNSNNNDDDNDKVLVESRIFDCYDRKIKIIYHKSELLPVEYEVMFTFPQDYPFKPPIMEIYGNNILHPMLKNNIIITCDYSPALDLKLLIINCYCILLEIQSYDWSEYSDLDKLEFLMRVSNEEFRQLESVPQLKDLFTEMIYEERCRTNFDRDIIDSRENLTWKEFYNLFNEN